MAEQTQDTTQQILDPLLPTSLLKDEIDHVTTIYNIAIDYLTQYSFQIIGAIIIFFIGFWISGRIAGAVFRLCSKHNLDITLSQFISNTTKMILVILITIVALGKLGISITPFIATIGALSLGAGLALQGLLANYVAGFNIILIRPFVVGDTIQVQGVKGIVKEVLLAYTILLDEDGVSIMIPNKHIVGEVLHNSKNDSLLELTVGIAYEHNPIEVVALVEDVISKLGIAGDQKETLVGIDEFADSSINIGIRVWTPTANLYAAKFKAYQEIYLALEQANIKIPFPQRDVHLIQSVQNKAS